MYKFQISTELMKNQKAAQALSNLSQFDALQTTDGKALFFSIGDDQMFYLSAEQENGKTGWTPVNLTSELGANFTGKTLTAKTFSVSQHLQSGNLLIAQAVHVAEDNADHLYLLSDLTGAPGAAWLGAAENRGWLARPFDDVNHPLSGSLDIAYVNITPHQDTTQAPYVVVGVRNQETSYIQNYLVNVDPNVSSGVWKQHQTSENYDQLLGLNIGKAAGALSPGLYELYSLGDSSSLTFTPLRGMFGAPPTVTKLTPPAGASAIATLPVDGQGHTNLYVAGEGGIYFYAYNNQGNFSSGQQIITSDLVSGVQNLEVHLVGSQVVLWGHNSQGQVFYARCPQNMQSAPASWSSPIPIQEGVAQMATVLNRQTEGNELYAHTAGQQLVRLTQDPLTTEWRAQGILLPSLNVDDVIEFYTYTTHINVVDENNLPLPNTSFPVTGSAPRTAYLNDTYVSLSPTVPLQAQSDATATVTLVQETTTLSAFCYDLVQGDGTKVSINPMQNVMGLMQKIKSGADLQNVTVTDEQGQSSPLLSPDVTQKQSDDTASAVQQFVQISTKMPQDGSVQTRDPASASFRATFNPGTDQIWGMSFENNDVRYFAGLDQMQAMGVSYNAGSVAVTMPTGEAGDIWHGIEAVAGDIFRWLERAYDKVTQFIIKTVDDVVHFFIQIGSEFYHFVINCLSDVVRGIEFVFKKIAVGLEKLVQWVGFIFNWDDILRTHNVLKNIFRQYVSYAIANLSTYHDILAKRFGDLQGEMSGWTNLNVPDNIQTSAAKSTPRPGQTSAQAHWGVYHAKNGAASASSSYSPVLNSTDEMNQALNDLASLLKEEETNIQNLGQNLYTQVFAQIKQLPASEIVSRFLHLIKEFLLESAGDIILKTIDIIQLFVEGLTGMLDATIEIPVLSWLYRKITGNPLSILDLICLVMAIPATIVYKLAEEKAPFPDNPSTQALINATDFAAIQKLFASGDSVAALSPPGLASVKLQTEADVLTFTFQVCALFGSLVIGGLTAVKIANAQDPAAFSFLYALAYLPYVAPSIPVSTTVQTWDVIMNEAVAGVSVVKYISDVVIFLKSGKEFAVIWDHLSPALDFVINVVWEVPVIAGLARSQNVNEILNFLGNTSFNAGGWLAPFARTENPEALVAVIVCTLLYGVLEFVQAVD